MIFPRVSYYYNHTLLTVAGLKKKIVALSKLKGFSLISEWTRGIINHIYWCASTSSDGGIALAKWESLTNHLQNQHDNHGNPLYPKCIHGQLRKKWFKPGEFCTCFVWDTCTFRYTVHLTQNNIIQCICFCIILSK